MLVTFTCNSYENITYFGDIALRLLHLMGHSGTIPGAIKAEDVAQALDRLQQGIGNAKKMSSSPKTKDEEEIEPDVSLAHRAVPLINMLEAAIKKNSDVLWSN